MKEQVQSIEKITIPKNLYGYRINITHPEIKPLYDRFKKWKNVPAWCPLSDKERLEFEGYILKKYEVDKDE